MICSSTNGLTILVIIGSACQAAAQGKMFKDSSGQSEGYRELSGTGFIFTLLALIRPEALSPLLFCNRDTWLEAPKAE